MNTDDYSVTVTVKDNDGKVISDLAVVPLGDNEINSPGANTQALTGSGSSSSTGTSADTSSSASASSSESAAAGMRSAQADSMAWIMVSTVAASFLIGFLG